MIMATAIADGNSNDDSNDDSLVIKEEDVLKLLSNKTMAYGTKPEKIAALKKIVGEQMAIAAAIVSLPTKKSDRDSFGKEFDNLCEILKKEYRQSGRGENIRRDDNEQLNN
jgi:hypothetical protein